MGAGQTLAGVSFQVVGVFSILGGIAYLLLGGGVALTGGVGGIFGALILAIFAVISVGLGLGFWFLGGMLRRMGKRKK